MASWEKSHSAVERQKPLTTEPKEDPSSETCLLSSLSAVYHPCKVVLHGVPSSLDGLWKKTLTHLDMERREIPEREAVTTVSLGVKTSRERTVGKTQSLVGILHGRSSSVGESGRKKIRGETRRKSFCWLGASWLTGLDLVTRPL
ncbi:hypothetical protein Bbelb_301140 [Branchiostoma belcheri]|nr:hypothetical protein Bbelb_301140 [Branchiostoma belcheri]